MAAALGAFAFAVPACTLPMATHTTMLTHRLTLSSRMEEIDRLDAFLDALNSLGELEEDRLTYVRLVLEECITNAMRHGNGMNPQKQVTVLAAEKPHELEFRIGDEGTGFDIDSLPDPTAIDRRELPGGRGVFLIRQLADDARYCQENKQFIVCFRY